MLIKSDEREPIAKLLSFLEYGERLAHDCANAQAVLVDDPRLRRFLLSQARQESMHAWVFQGAIAWLAPRHLGANPSLPALERYRVLLHDALARRDLAETLLAEQIILEGLGEAILRRIEAGLVKREAPLGRLRRVLLHQEEAHYEFGCRQLERLIEAGFTSPDQLRARVPEYLGLTAEMVTTLADVFASINEDATDWAADVQGYLPSWLMNSPCLEML